jgi:PPOX class probable F420-dependent enzyme
MPLPLMPVLAKFVCEEYVQPARREHRRRFSIVVDNLLKILDLKKCDASTVSWFLGSKMFCGYGDLHVTQQYGANDDPGTVFNYELHWTEDEVREFTDKPLLAILGTIYPSITPQLTVVWYDYDGTDFRVTTIDGWKTVKLRNIHRDPRVTLAIVNTSYQNFDKLVVRGRATITKEGAHDVLIAHVKRYLSPKESETTLRDRYKPDPERVVIKIKPEKYL